MVLEPNDSNEMIMLSTDVGDGTIDASTTQTPPSAINIYQGGMELQSRLNQGVSTTYLRGSGRSSGRALSAALRPVRTTPYNTDIVSGLSGAGAHNTAHV